MSRSRKHRRQRLRRWLLRQARQAVAAERAPAGRFGRRVRLTAGAVVALAVLAPMAAVSVCLVLAGSPGLDGPPKAAIVDQLSLTFPNLDFVEKATNGLEQAGYLVDHYQGEEVTVGLYRCLPKQDYDLIVFGVHAARFHGVYRGEQLDEALLFTNDPYGYRKTYFQEMVDGRLALAYTHEGAPRYFGITADFVEFGMQGELNDALVIMMGCEGLASDRTSEAFVNKGADSYISWSNTVSASHTDAGTLRLLELMLDDGQSAQDAVAQVMDEIGPDPAYDSVLRAYPAEG